MRNALPIVLILLAAAAGYWLLTGAQEELPEPGLQSADEPDGGGPTPESMQAEGMKAEGLAVKGKQPGRKRPLQPVADPRKLPKGTLLITFVGPDLKTLDSGSLRVYIEPSVSGVWRTKLPLYDKDKRVWRAERVVAGPVKVRVLGDHVVARTVKHVVRKNRDNDLQISLDLAGAIRYDVIAYDKTRPDPVQLTLYDFEKKPVRVWYQERTNRRMTTPLQYETAKIGPEGVIFGILPGRYRLRVVSPNEEWDDAEVDIVAGKTAKVSLEVRR